MIIQGGPGVVSALNKKSEVVPMLAPPTWEVYPATTVRTFDGSKVSAQQAHARAPLYDKTYAGKIAIEYGRMAPSRQYKSSSLGYIQRGRGNISAWSNHILAPVTGTGYGGGFHTNVSFLRENRHFILPNQLAVAVPYWSFFKKTQGIGLFDDNAGGSSLNKFEYFRLTGSKSQGKPINLNRRMFNSLTNMYNHQGLFYARTVLIENGKLVAYSAWSEPLIVRPTPLPFGIERSKMVCKYTQDYGNYAPEFRCTVEQVVGE